jgi:uroporphyrin-III C-methyltransferase / precorrin-2 dehydrogenase / sirohydrochlorin ferrochelatase
MNKTSIDISKNSSQKVKNYSNKTLPILLKDQKILLIGGGSVAHQKAKVLKSNNIDFEIIAESIKDEIKFLDVKFILKRFEPSDLKDFNIVIDATGNKEVNKLLKKIKKRRFFLLNSVDIPEECDFYFSSLLLYKNLKIAISSDGGSPTLTQFVRDKIKEVIPNEIGKLAETKLLERSKNIIDVEKTKREAAEIFGKVFLVGCGPGDPELLTIRALKIIRSADIILHDSLVTEEILEYAKSEAQIFCVGKRKGLHKFEQDETNIIMLEYAKAGYKVARLKGGDPYIFGRGAEEAEFLINNEIEVEVIPGISSAFAAPLLAGIPLTTRGYSSEVSIVSGHQKNDDGNIDWIDLLKRKNHTTIVLMGLTKIEEILINGIKNGVDNELPVAIISNISKENEKILTSKFENILEIAEEAEKPAVLIFGECVKLHEKLYRNNRIKFTLES